MNSNKKKYDLIIRNGSIIDGTGRRAYKADIAITKDKIVKIGCIDDEGLKEIDAKEFIITPGFVDIHTHYDGQAIWDSYLKPSSIHGVTTVVMGNCGVGFAPCNQNDREKLVELMEGVEDIPSPVMHEGLNWNWETFPEYLNALEHNERDIDVCTLIPHACGINVQTSISLSLCSRAFKYSGNVSQFQFKPSCITGEGISSTPSINSTNFSLSF